MGPSSAPARCRVQSASPSPRVLRAAPGSSFFRTTIHINHRRETGARAQVVVSVKNCQRHGRSPLVAAWLPSSRLSARNLILRFPEPRSSPERSLSDYPTNRPSGIRISKGKRLQGRPSTGGILLNRIASGGVLIQAQRGKGRAVTPPRDLRALGGGPCIKSAQSVTYPKYKKLDTGTELFKLVSKIRAEVALPWDGMWTVREPATEGGWLSESDSTSKCPQSREIDSS